MHQDGKLVKVPTTDVVVTPNTVDSIPLDQLNLLISEQKGMALDELALEIGTQLNSEEVRVEEIAQVKEQSSQNPVESVVEPMQNPEVTPTPTFESAEAEAKYYRSQADALAKKAADFRRKAEELVPTKKKATKATETVDA